VEIRRVRDADDAALWLELRNRVLDDRLTPEGRERLRAMAPDRVELLATLEGRPAGAAVVGSSILEPSSRRAVAGVLVLAGERGRGVGSALYAALSTEARRLGKNELEANVRASDVLSVQVIERRGFVEVGRVQKVVLELSGAGDVSEPRIPHGLRLVSLADRPELAHGMYEVSLEAMPDVPAPERLEPGTFEEWRRVELDGSAAIPALSLVALTGDEPVGYATLGDFGAGEALHLMTGVRRSWRGRGVARVLKQAQIAGARRAGLERLVAFNDAGNEPMRRLNERLGYVPTAVNATFRGPLAPIPG
jgi:mycothiol synthase